MDRTTMEDLNMEDPIEVFVANAYRRENRRAKLDNLRSKASRPLVEGLQDLERSMGAESMRASLIAYLRSEDGWLRENRWPLRFFISRRGEGRWLDGVEEGARETTARPLESAATPLDSGSVENNHTIAEPAVKKPGVDDAVAAWNAANPDAPFDGNWGLHGSLRARVVLALADPAFDGVAVAEKSSKLRSAAPEYYGFLDFPRLFATHKDSGQAFWQRVVTGAYDHSLKNKSKSGRGGSTPDISRIVREYFNRGGAA